MKISSIRRAALGAILMPFLVMPLPAMASDSHLGVYVDLGHLVGLYKVHSGHYSYHGKRYYGHKYGHKYGYKYGKPYYKHHGHSNYHGKYHRYGHKNYRSYPHRYHSRGYSKSYKGRGFDGRRSNNRTIRPRSGSVR